jgi:bacteriocin-like protein
MSNQSNPQEVKQHLLEQLEASKQAIQELNDDELASVTGGKFSFKHGAISAAASFFGPQLLGGLFGGGSSSQSQSQSK